MNNNAPQNQLPPQANGGQNTAAQTPAKRQLPAGWPEKLSDVKVKLGPNDVTHRGL